MIPHHMTKPSLVDQGVLISVGCFRLLSRDKKVASLARQYCFAALSERNSFTGSRAAARTMTGKGQWRIQLIRQHRFVSFAFTAGPIRRSIDLSPRPSGGPSHDARAYSPGAACLPDAAAILQ